MVHLRNAKRPRQCPVSFTDVVVFDVLGVHAKPKGFGTAGADVCVGVLPHFISGMSHRHGLCWKLSRQGRGVPPL